MFYIRLYHSYDRDFGYNVSLGGCYNKNRERNEWERKMLRNLRRQICIDPIIGDTITYSALQARKNRNKEKYKDVVLRQCLVEVNNEKVFCCSGLSE